MPMLSEQARHVLVRFSWSLFCKVLAKLGITTFIAT
jgi:hypothetical protein